MPNSQSPLEHHRHHWDHALLHPHIGMRKVKSLLAILLGFCIWKVIRIFLPELDRHPLFIYIYGMIEIRESSEMTQSYGKQRIFATLIAVCVGLPVMGMMDVLKEVITSDLLDTILEIGILLGGTLLVLCLAEWFKCKLYCGLAASIYVILIVSHMDNSMYLNSIMRVVQTVIGVLVAWFLNVVLLPYPPRPGSLSDKLMRKHPVQTAAKQE